jgi:serine/threonine-protein kinase
MEYIEGKTLDQLIGRIEVRPALVVFQKVAAALAHMQRRQVLHGDLQPSNVFLSRTGQVKVRGYGRNEIDPKYKEKIQSHPNYAAPEQLKSKMVTSQTEVYNLGATMYHTLTGQPPIADLRGRTEGQKLAMPSVLNVKIPSVVNNVIVSCLQSNPNKRPAEPYLVLQELDRLVKEMNLDDSLLAGLTVDEG